MPTTWFRYRSVLAVSLFFPWFPSVPTPSPEPQSPAVTAAAHGGVEPQALQAAGPAREEPLVLPGVVIEEIPKGSALEKAGLQVGDVILSWERLPNPPANPEGAQGELSSYFDWLELEVEQVPRGAVVLRGRRGGEPFGLKVEPGLWEAKVRPVLTGLLEEMYLAGQSQLAAGHVEAAVQAWSSVAKRVGHEGDGNLRTWFALRIGDTWEEQTRWEKAIETFREALDISDDFSAQVVILEALGVAHDMKNEHEAAEKVLMSGFEIRQKLSQESLGLARSLNYLARVASHRGEADRALAYSLRALQINERLAPGSLNVAKSLSNLGTLAWGRGDLSGAHAYDLRALQINEQLAPESLEVANSWNNLGAWAFDRGDLGLAESYFSRALSLRERLAPQSLELAQSLNNLGVVATSRGDLDRSAAYFLRSLRINEQLAPQSLSLAANLNNLGVQAMSRGDFSRAHAYLLATLHIEEQLAPQSLAVATTFNNLGNVAAENGDLVLANEYNLQALRIRRRLAPQSLSVANSLYNLGRQAQDQGSLARAYAYYSEALSIQERLAPDSLDLASSLAGLATVALRRRELNSAFNFYRRALRISEQHAPKSLSVAIYLKHLGAVASARGEADRANGFYAQALEALENQLSKLGSSYEVQADFRTKHQGYWQDALALFLTQGRTADAFRALERFRAQTFLTMLAERDTAFTADIPEELDRERRRLGVQYDRTLKKLALLNPRDNGEEIEATRRELKELDDEAGDIEVRIRQASPRLAALQYPKPLDATEAQQALDPGTLLLSYCVGKESTVLFALSPSGDLDVKIVPLGEAALRSQVKQLLSLTREAIQGSALGAIRQQRLLAASRELYTELLGPVAERIAASERLLILPDGPLHALPFAALARDVGVDGTANGFQYLAEWKPTHVALSATVFAELKQRRRPAGESQAPFQLAAFGDPVYPQSLKSKGVAVAALPTGAGAIAQVDVPRGDPVVRSAAERGVFDWQPLPYTRHEVEGIARLFPEGTARTFLGPEALEERIKSLDPKTRILHLAAHGYTDEHLPSSSFVALTIPEDTNPAAADTNRDNGLLQVWEIFEKVRLDADLVVLSACDTALGEEQGGEGLIGLTRAFQYAGARTVMASLWSVQDQATSELMIRFYKHLRAGLSKDEALRQAQIELIRGPIEVVDEKGEKTLLDATAPYYWAGFQVYGDWQ